MLYKVLRRDWGSNFLVQGTVLQGTLLQPKVGEVFEGQKVSRNLCTLPSSTGTEVCSTRDVIMGIATIPIVGTQVEFYFPSNYVKAGFNVGGMFITIPTILIGAGVLFVGYKLLKNK
jgi:hypothetical protein